MARQPLYDNSQKRTVQDTVAERDLRHGRVRNYGNGGDVLIEWDMNEQSTADHVCKITIGGKTAYVDSEQMMKFLRWV